MMENQRESIGDTENVQAFRPRRWERQASRAATVAAFRGAEHADGGGVQLRTGLGIVIWFW